jgi:hypothetical protein
MAPIAEIVAKAIEAVGGAEAWALLTARERIGADLYNAQQGHGVGWQMCLAYQLPDCQFAIEAGDTIFAPRMKAPLLRAFVLARRRHHLAESTRTGSGWSVISMR